MKDSYEGPRDGKGDLDHASRNWCGGIVVGCSRFVHYPMVTEYSRAVARRIAAPKYQTPGLRLVDLLEWRREA